MTLDIMEEMKDNIMENEEEGEEKPGRSCAEEILEKVNDLLEEQHGNGYHVRSRQVLAVIEVVGEMLENLERNKFK